MHHWDILAADLATRLAPRMPKGTPVNIEFSPDDSAFGKGLRTLLLSRLSDVGIVFSAEAGALQLEISTQVARHAVPKPTEPLKFTVLGTGIAVLHDVLTHTVSSETVYTNLIGLGLLMDAVRWSQQGLASGGPTGTELLVATVLRDGSRDLARTADIYYIEQTDATLYRQSDQSAKVKTWGVVDK